MNEYRETAKRLGIRFRIGKYGLVFLNRDPTGRIYKLMQVVRLDGWSFDPQEIIESFATDPAFSIRYADTKGNDLQPSDSDTKCRKAEA